ASSPARCHDPDAVKNPDRIYLDDSGSPKTSHGAVLTGIGDKCLDVRGGDPADGTVVQIFECHGRANQRWEFVEVAPFFELRGLEGKCVQPVDPPGGEDRNPLMIGPCGGLEDRWEPGTGFPGEFALVHVSTGKCMDVQGASTDNRTPVNAFPCQGGPNQVWSLDVDLPSGIVGEVEPNDELAAAQVLAPEDFTRAYDPDVGDRAGNTSIAMPHVKVRGTGNDTFDYYAFTVENAGDRGIFDIDNSNMDAYLRLFDSTGTRLALNDDAPTTWGAGGSDNELDSFLEYTFSAPGLYVIEVGRCCLPDTVPDGASYELQISIGSEQAILLNRDRFLVSIDWTTPDSSGPGIPVEFRTGDSGLFYFFSPNNLEILVKVLDGCVFNGRYWVFFAATTDVEFTLTVFDSINDVTRTYYNPPGNPADAVTDTAAFATCP
ncbi:MAG: hypothetical protein GY722_23445, partial [bacterium]|nr:hypothetical protein [bacterium]